MISKLNISLKMAVFLPIFSLLFLGEIGLPIISLCLAVYIVNTKLIAVIKIIKILRKIYYEKN